MAKIVYATLTAHITEDHFVTKGDPYPVDHPAVVRRPDCFTKPEPDPELEPEQRLSSAEQKLEAHDKHDQVVARLHPGEKIITAEQAKKLKKQPPKGSDK